MAVSLTIEAKLGGVWTDITVDRAHPSDAPMTLQGGILDRGPAALVGGVGRWAFFLDNSVHCSGGVAGYYSPNSASCRTNWGIGVQCRLGVTIGANPKYYRFVGWVQAITPMAGLYEQQTVEVAVTDWMDQAAGAVAAGLTVQQNQTGDQLVGTLVGLVANAPHGTSYDAGSDTYLYAFDDLDPSASRVLDGLVRVARSGLDRIYVKGDTSTGGVLRFESHTFRRTFASDAYVLADTPPGGQPCLALIDLQAAKRRDSLINELRLTTHPRKIDGSTVVLYGFNIAGAAAQPIAAGGGVLTIWANYADPNQLAQQVAGTSMVTPAATTDYTFNSASDGSGTDLTASVTVSATFFASTAKLVITNTHPSLSAYVTKLQLRGKGIYTYQGVVTDSLNSGAQTANGQILSAIDMPYQSSQVQAQAAADYLVGLYTSSSWSDLDDVAVFCHVGDETSLWSLIQTEVSTPLSITETMIGYLTYPVWVNNWSIEIDERDSFTFRLGVEPRDPNQYWSLGVAGLSELGTTTFLGPF